MYKVNSLNPKNFEPFHLKNQTSSMLFDHCNFLGIPIKIDKSSDLCEFKLKSVLPLMSNQKGIHHNFPKDYGDHNDIRQLLSIDWKFLAKNKNKKLVITQKIPTIFTNFIKPLNHIVKKYELYGRVFWLGLNPLEEKHQSFCNFKILNINPWTTVYCDEAIRGEYSDVTADFQYSSLSEATCHFVSLCARKKFFRSLATYLFYKKNLHKKGLYSFLGWKGEVENEKKELVSKKRDLIFHGIPFEDYFTFVTEHNKPLDFTKHPWMVLSENWYNAAGNMNKQGLVNLVFESTSGLNEIFITEKTVRSFVKGRPFLLLGNPNSLKYLREVLGFKTFDFLFDESYDREVNQIVRVQKVIQQLENFCSKPFDYQKQIISEHQHILDHNFKTAANFPHKKLFLDLLRKINV